MGKQLPILPATAQPTGTAAEKFVYSRVFCRKGKSLPSPSHDRIFEVPRPTPILPTDMTEEALDEWAWVHVTLHTTAPENLSNFFASATAAPIKMVRTGKRPVPGGLDILRRC